MKGISLIALIITIAVIIIISFITISGTYTAVDKANEASYKASLKELESHLALYLQDALCRNIQYDEEELSWGGGRESPINTARIKKASEEDSIETVLGKIPKNVKNDIAILNGKLVIKSSCIAQKKEWAAEIGIFDNAVKTNILTLAKGTKTFNGVVVTVSDDGVINLKGKPTGNIFFRLTKKLLANSTYSDFSASDDILVKSGKKISFVLEDLNNNYTGDGFREDTEFNAILRDSSNSAVFKIKMLNKERVSYGPSNDGTVTNNITYAYLFMKGDVEFFDYQFRLKLYEYSSGDVEQNTEEETTNVFYMTPGEGIDELKTKYGLTVSITDDYKINISGTSKERCFIALSNGKPAGYTSSTLMKDFKMDSASLIAAQNSNVQFNVSINDRSKIHIPSGGQFNVALRSKDGNVATFDNGNSSFNCKYGDVSPTTNMSGRIFSPNVTMLYFYVTAGIRFDDGCVVTPELIVK